MGGYSGAIGNYFAGQDIDDSGWSGSASPSQLTWTGINITGYTDLEFTGLFASSYTDGADDIDYVLIEYKIDAGSWTNLLAFENDGTEYNTELGEDTNFDGDSDGTDLTGAFASFTKSIATTGNSLDLRITVALNSGKEDIGFDEFEIDGISASGTNPPSSFQTNCATEAGINLTWTKPSGTYQTDWDGVVVFARATSANDANITGDDGSTISASLVYGSGTQDGNSFCVVNQNTDADGNITVTNLTAGTTYYFIAYTYLNGSPDTWSAATSEISATATAIADVSGATATSGDTELTLDWTNPTMTCYDNVLIVGRSGSAVEAAVSKGNLDDYAGDEDFTANTTWLSGDDVEDITGLGTAATNYVVYKGTGTSATITGLTNSTTYHFRIFVEDGTGTYTRWSTGVDVSGTPAADPCATGQTIPWSENFDGVSQPTMPDCWEVTNDNSDSYEWVTCTNTSLGNATAQPPHSGLNQMGIRYNSSAAMDDWFFTPPLALTNGTTYKLTFWFASACDSYTEKLEVKYGTDHTAASMTSGNLADITDINAVNYPNYTEYTVSFTPSSTDDFHIGFHGYSIANQCYIFIDDIGVTEANDEDSDVDGPNLAGQPSITTISSLVDTDGEAVRVFDFDIYDYGTSDGLTTDVTQITIKAGTNNTANWSTVLQNAKISLDGGTTFVTTGAPTITASTIVFPIASGNLVVADTDIETVSLLTYLNTTGITDNQILEFKVDGTAHGFTADASGSQFATTFTGTTPSPVSNQITIQVAYTLLVFTQQPSDVVNGAVMSPSVTVTAQDANGNTDVDFNGASYSVGLNTTGTFDGSATTEVDPVNGVATFSNLIFSVTETGRTITTTDPDTQGWSNITSNPTFDITDAPSVYISEIAGDGVGGDFDDEYIELSNSGSSSLDLNGWQLLYYHSSLEKTITFGSGDAIPANDAFVIAARSSYDAADLTPDYVSSFSMNAHCYVVLKNASGTIIDEAGSSGDKFNDDHNYEFTDCASDNKPVTNWDDLGVSGVGTPGSINCASANDTDSEASAPGTQINPGTTIASTFTGYTNVFKFDIDDKGTADGVATKVTNIRIYPHSSNTADWTDHIQDIKLNDGLDLSLNPITITDTYIDIPISGTYDVADGTSKEITLSIQLNTTNLVDGAILSFMVDTDTHGFTANGSTGSNFASTFVSGVDFNSADFTIGVTATELRFITNKPPATAGLNSDFLTSIEATDVYGNRDLSDNSSSITLTINTGVGAISSATGLTQTLSSGIYEWTDIRIDAVGIHTIHADDGATLTDVNSGDVNITTGPTTIWWEDCTPNHTWTNDGTANWVIDAPGTNPSANGTSGDFYKTKFENQEYLKSKEYTLTSEAIDLTNYTDCEINFDMWLGSELYFDGGVFECYSSGMGTWTKMDADLAYDGYVSALEGDGWDGSKKSWQTVNVDISVFDGESDFQFRYRFKSDASNQDYGWAVDNMEVIGTPTGLSNVTNITINDNCLTEHTVNWDLPTNYSSGSNTVLVFAKATNAITVGTPSSDISTYTADNDFSGAGTAYQNDASAKCVYKGDGANVTITGLTAGTTYHYLIFNIEDPDTYSSGATANETSLSNIENVTGLTATPANQQVVIDWTNVTSCFDEVMIVAKPLTTIGASPSGDGSAYTADLQFNSGSGTAFDGTGKVVYKGSTSPQTIYDLTNGTLYYFKIFTRSGSNWSSGVEVSETPTPGPIAADGSGTATVVNGGAGNINGKDIFQRNKTNQIINIEVTGVSSGWLKKVKIDLSNFIDNSTLITANITLTGGAVSGNTTKSIALGVITINNLILTDTDILSVEVTAITTNDVTVITDMGNYNVPVQTAGDGGTDTDISSIPDIYLTIPFDNAKDFTIVTAEVNATLDNRNTIVAVEGTSTIGSGRLTYGGATDYDQFFIQEGEGAGASGLCIRDDNQFAQIRDISKLYIIKGPLKVISGSTTTNTNVYENMTAISNPTQIIDLGATTLPAPYIVSINTLRGYTYEQFEAVDGLLMRIQDVTKASGSWPLEGNNGSVDMTDVSTVDDLRCYIFKNTDVDSDTEPTWTKNMVTLVYNYDNGGNWKYRQITPVYMSNLFDNIIWNGSVNDLWSVARNWTPAMLPQDDDDVVFDNVDGPANSYTVLYDVATAQTINSMRINPTTGKTIEVTLPNTNSLSPALTINKSGDAIVIETGGTLIDDFEGSGTTLTLAASGTDGKLRINNGGRFIWRTDVANTYVVDRLSTVAGTETGVFEYDIQSAGNEAISASGKTYGTLELTASDGSNNYKIQGTGDLTIKGDFIINENVSVGEMWGATKYQQFSF